MSEIFGKDALFSFVNEHYGIEPDYPFSDDASAVLGIRKTGSGLHLL